MEGGSEPRDRGSSPSTAVISSHAVGRGARHSPLSPVALCTSESLFMEILFCTVLMSFVSQGTRVLKTLMRTVYGSLECCDSLSSCDVVVGAKGRRRTRTGLIE